MANATEAEKIVRQHTRWAFAGGLIPISGIDLAAVGLSQLRMLAKLSEHYGIEFAENRAKSLVTTLIAPLASKEVARGVVGSALKSVPVIGLPFGIAGVALFAGASTHAVGKVFMHHFESGGDFMDFSTDSTKEYFSTQYEEATELFSKKKDSEDKPASKSAPAAKTTAKSKS